MSISLDSLIENLAFRFKTSAGYASKIFYNHHVAFSLRIKTVDLLGTPEQTFSCKHFHFSGNFNKVEDIGDCTDQWIQRSSNPKAQYQTYSVYKSHNIVKNLVFCSKSVPFRYSVIAYSTSATD